jgi:hypothetical protein
VIDSIYGPVRREPIGLIGSPLNAHVGFDLGCLFDRLIRL